MDNLEIWIKLFDNVLNEDESIRQPAESEIMQKLENDTTSFILTCIEIFPNQEYTERARDSSLIYLAKVLSTDSRAKLRKLREFKKFLNQNPEGGLNFQMIEEAICKNIEYTQGSQRNKCIEIFASLFNIQRESFLPQLDPFITALEQGSSEDCVITGIKIFEELFSLPNWKEIYKTEGLMEYCSKFVPGCVHVFGFSECSLQFRIIAAKFVGLSIANMEDLICNKDACIEIFESADSAFSSLDASLFEETAIVIFQLCCNYHNHISEYAEDIYNLMNRLIDKTEAQYIPFQTLIVRYWTEITNFETNNKDDFHIAKEYFDRLLELAMTCILRIDRDPDNPLQKGGFDEINLSGVNLLGALFKYDDIEFVDKVGDIITELSNAKENWASVYGFLLSICAISKEKVQRINSESVQNFIRSSYRCVFNYTYENPHPLIIETSLWTLSEMIKTFPWLIREDPTESIAEYNAWIGAINIEVDTEPMLISRYLRVVNAINSSQFIDSDRNILTGIFDADLSFLFTVYSYPRFAEFVGIKNIATRALDAFILNAPKSLNPRLIFLMEYIIGMIGEEPEGMSEADALERSARLVSHISALAKRLCRMIPTEIYDKALLPIRYYLDNRNIIMYPDSVICFGNLVAGKFFNEESDSELLEKVFYYFNDTMISYSPEIIKSGCIMIESIYKKIGGLQPRLDEVLGMINEMLETANLVAISPIMPFICNAVSTIVKESGPYEEPNEAAKSLVQTMIVNLYQKEFDVDNEDGIESANLHYNGVVNLFDAYRECLWIFQHDDISAEKEFLNMIIGLADSLLHIPEIYDELMENYCNFLRKCAFEVNRKNCLLLNRSKIKKVLDNASPKMRAYAEATKEFVRNA